MPIKSVTFEGETEIRYEIQLETSEDKPRFWCILVLSFSGRYRSGHHGAPDAGYIRGIMQAALGVWRPKALILDFRKLDYTWGDEMEEVLGCRGEIELPYAVVLGDQCRPAITTLLQVFNPKIVSATEHTLPMQGMRHTFRLGHIFDDMEGAWKYVHQKT
jgi:hypothetical protein